MVGTVPSYLLAAGRQDADQPVPLTCFSLLVPPCPTRKHKHHGNIRVMVHVSAKANGEPNLRGIPLAFCHGYVGESAAYYPILGMLSRRFCVIAIDMIGHGGSDKLPYSAYRLDVYSELFGCALHCVLGVRGGFKGGHSLGGRVALNAALANHELTHGLVLANAIVGLSWDRRVNTVVRGRLLRPPLVEGVVLIKQLHDDAMAGIEAMRHNPAIPPEVVRFAETRFREIFRSAIPHVGRWIPGAAALVLADGSMPRVRRLNELGIPILVAHASGDPVVEQSNAMQIAAVTGRHPQILNGPHMWPVSHPELGSTLLETVLNEDHWLREALDALVVEAAGGLAVSASTINRYLIDQGQFTRAFRASLTLTA